MLRPSGPVSQPAGPEPPLSAHPRTSANRVAGVSSMPSGLRPVAQYDSPMAHAWAMVLSE